MACIGIRPLLGVVVTRNESDHISSFRLYSQQLSPPMAGRSTPLGFRSDSIRSSFYPFLFFLFTWSRCPNSKNQLMACSIIFVFILEREKAH